MYNYPANDDRDPRDGGYRDGPPHGYPPQYAPPRGPRPGHPEVGILFLGFPLCLILPHGREAMQRWIRTPLGISTFSAWGASIFFYLIAVVASSPALGLFSVLVGIAAGVCWIVLCVQNPTPHPRGFNPRYNGGYNPRGYESRPRYDVPTNSRGYESRGSYNVPTNNPRSGYNARYSEPTNVRDSRYNEDSRGYSDREPSRYSTDLHVGSRYNNSEPSRYNAESSGYNDREPSRYTDDSRDSDSGYNGSGSGFNDGWGDLR